MKPRRVLNVLHETRKLSFHPVDRNIQHKACIEIPRAPPGCTTNSRSLPSTPQDWLWIARYSSTVAVNYRITPTLSQYTLQVTHTHSTLQLLAPTLVNLASQAAAAKRRKLQYLRRTTLGHCHCQRQALHLPERCWQDANILAPDGGATTTGAQWDTSAVPYHCR